MSGTDEAPGRGDAGMSRFDSMIDAMGAAICRQMRRDIGRPTDWSVEPERNRDAFRRAAMAALAAQSLFNVEHPIPGEPPEAPETDQA